MSMSENEEGNSRETYVDVCATVNEKEIRNYAVINPPKPNLR